jgi:hypothetical protein
MLREQTINFLEATVVFLLLTNALSIVAATWAIHIASRVTAAPAAVARLGGVLGAWSGGPNVPPSGPHRIRSR